MVVAELSQVSASSEDVALAHKIESRLKRIFFHEDFDDLVAARKIIGPMPSLESYIEKRRQLRLESNRLSMPDHIRAACDEPLLSAEQEIHLFRRYNYHKHRAMVRLEQGNLMVACAELKLADSVRKQITSANVRLAISITKKYSGHRHFEDLISESYFYTLRAVDYFDWRKGFKFSTYLTMVVRRAMGKAAFMFTQHDYRYSTDDDSFEEGIVSGSSGHAEEAHIKSLRDIIEQLLEHCTPRERAVIELRFFEEKTLQAIADDYGVTKERIRQLEKRGLERIQEMAAELGLKYEDM